MSKVIAWTATCIVLAVLAWQVADSAPQVPRVVAALLILVIGFLAGLRVGADSAAAYIRDLQRLNKVMAEQQQDLKEMNAELLKQIKSARG